jgi:type II secretory pathway predicted ATPase ExeA
MYTEYYALTGRPFQLSPEPGLLLRQPAHRRAVAYFTFGLQQGKGFIVITGEVGDRQDDARRLPAEQLSDQRLLVALVSALSLRADDVPRLVAQALALDPAAASKASVLGLIEHDLGACHGRGQRILLVVDEAQNLASGALETLHALSNLEREGRALLQILLLGQPQFRDTLASPALERLRQRVVASAHLGPLEPDEVRPYLEHRLRRVGWSGRPAFEPAIFGEIWAYSRGLPRRINLLAARLLVHGAIDRRATLTARTPASWRASSSASTPCPTRRPPAADNHRAGAQQGRGRRRRRAGTAPPAGAAAAARGARVLPARGRAAAPQARERLRRPEPRAHPVRRRAGGGGAAARELHRIEVERLRVDAETTRRLAEVLGETGAGNGHRRGGGLLRRLI